MLNTIKTGLTGLTAFIVLNGLIAAPGYSFPDTQGHQYGQAIDYVKTHNIVGGYPDGTFKPNQTINRAEFTKIVVGATVGQPPATGENCFSDVFTSQWFQPFVCYAKSMYIINGYPDGSFGPERTINYAEAAKIIVETFDIPAAPAIGQVQWYESYITALRVVGANPSPEPNPNALVTRAQLAHMIYSVLTSSNTSSSAGQVGCIVSGCSSQLCVSADSEPVATTCEWREEYACYQSATCERQTDGSCGWTQTPQLTLCLQDARSDTDLQPISYGGSYQDFTTGVIGKGDPVAVFFWASWCPYCQANEQRIQGWVASDNLGVNVYKIDYDAAATERARFAVSSQDTFILFDGEGREIERLTFPGEDQLKDLLSVR